MLHCGEVSLGWLWACEFGVHFFVCKVLVVPQACSPRITLHDMLCWVGRVASWLDYHHHWATEVAFRILVSPCYWPYRLDRLYTTSSYLLEHPYKLWLSSQNYSPLMLHTHTARAAGDTGKTKKSRWPNHSVLNFIYTWLMEMSNGPLPWCRLISNKKLQQSFSWYEIWSGLSFLLLLMKSLELIFKEL